MSAALELRQVTKRFGTVTAVRDLSLAVPEGAVYGLIGPNGAGKTTTFSLLAGFLHPTAGEVFVRGVRLVPGRPPVGLVLALPQDAQLPERARALDVLVMLGRLGGLCAAEARARGEAALARVGLADLGGRRLGALSHGQRRRVGIAQTLIGDGEVILLDEPTAGLDALAAAEIRALIRGLRGQRTVVLSSHNLQEIEALCDHAAIIDRGALITAGPMAEIRDASSLVQVRFTRPVAPGVELEGAVSALPGVRRVRLAADRCAVTLELADGSDEVTNRVLGVLIALGIGVDGLERGRSLEARFLEETAGR